MIHLHFIRENTAKIRENTRKLAIKTIRAADFRFCVPPVQESVPGNFKGAGIRMNTAPPTRVQYSWFVRAQGYDNILYYIYMHYNKKNLSGSKRSFIQTTTSV